MSFLFLSVCQSYSKAKIMESFYSNGLIQEIFFQTLLTV